MKTIYIVLLVLATILFYLIYRYLSIVHWPGQDFTLIITLLFALLSILSIGKKVSAYLKNNKS